MFVMGPKASGKSCVLELMGYVFEPCSSLWLSMRLPLAMLDCVLYDSGTVLAESGRVQLFGLDVNQSTLSSILSGDHHGIGICPIETFVWKDLTVQVRLCWFSPLVVCPLIAMVTRGCAMVTRGCARRKLCWRLAWCTAWRDRLLPPA